MSAKAIREATGKDLINKYLEGGNETGTQKSRFASVTESTDWSQLVVEHPWLESTVSTFYYLSIALRLEKRNFPRVLKMMICDCRLDDETLLILMNLCVSLSV